MSVATARPRRILAIGLTVLLAAPPVAEAQGRLAEGRILRARESGTPAPVAGEWVVLHRVGSDRAAPLDSVRSGRDGRFRFRYALTGDPQALYFVSARYQGIAYFSPPLRADTVRGEDADIIVYSTTRDTADLRMQGRHIVVSTPRGGMRDVAEIFEIENGGTRTVVATDSVTPLWTVALPPDARNAGVAPGDIAAGAVVFRDGRAELYAPLSPGVRQLMLTYQLPVANAAPAFPLQRSASVLEVLLEEPRATAEAAGLTEVAPGLIEGRQFHRFLAQDVPASAVVRLTLPQPVRQNRSALFILGAGVAGAMAIALGAWAWRSRRGPGQRPASVERRGTDDAERLIAELATLDARFERERSPSPEARVAYEQERARLKKQIAAAMSPTGSVPGP